MAKAITSLGELPDASMQALDERRQDVQRAAQQADGQCPTLTEAANQVYNELTEIMTLILMSQERKSKTEHKGERSDYCELVWQIRKRFFCGWTWNNI